MIKICECDKLVDKHHASNMFFWRKVPLKDGAHTSFFLLECHNCGGIYGFPPLNFKLALEKGTDLTIEQFNLFSQSILIV